jgi:hypothetical protein
VVKTLRLLAREAEGLLRAGRKIAHSFNHDVSGVYLSNPANKALSASLSMDRLAPPLTSPPTRLKSHSHRKISVTRLPPGDILAG